MKAELQEALFLRKQEAARAKKKRGLTEEAQERNRQRALAQYEEIKKRCAEDEAFHEEMKAKWRMQSARYRARQKSLDAMAETPEHPEWGEIQRLYEIGFDINYIARRLHLGYAMVTLQLRQHGKIK